MQQKPKTKIQVISNNERKKIVIPSNFATEPSATDERPVPRVIADLREETKQE
jgi:hypothetical protein